jgi:hypothetical protein
MKIGDTVIWDGRRVVLLGVEPMSVPDRLARVRDEESDDVRDVPYAELAEPGSFGPNP